MYGKVTSSCVHGIDGKLIEVEVDISNGLPQFNIVGLPDSAVRESMERVRAAIKNCKYSFPMERITINLAPADIKKEGSSFDLAIAIGILVTSGQFSADPLTHTLIIGELALDGAVRPVPGVLPMVQAAMESGMKTVFLPKENAGEAALIKQIKIVALSHLRELNEYSPDIIFNEINHMECLSSSRNALDTAPDCSIHEDYGDVQGQHHAKRALMIAATGMHNILLIGPPGSGKTMLIRRLPSILPPLTEQEALEVTKIYSIANQFTERSRFIQKRPFRSPHHTVSQSGLVGGGSIPKPGEISLAHRGVLFLDELPEFSRNVLEVLRQPLEDRYVTIGRAKAVFTFPSHFILAASMNPCPCGYLGSETKANRCLCSLLKTRQYRSRITGPLLDRIDLQVEVPRVDYGVIHSHTNNLSSAQMWERISCAQKIQKERYRNEGIHVNGELTGKLLREHCRLDDKASSLLQGSFDALGLSVRAHDRILKIARTIADLEGKPNIEIAHLAEALQYRSLDRKMDC